MPAPEREVSTQIDNGQINEFRQLAREFTQRESFADHIKLAETRPKQFSFEFMQEAATAGFLSLDLPEEYGGLGLTSQEKVTIIEELNRGHAGLGLCVLVQNSLSEYPIARYGNPEQKAEYLYSMAEGEIFGCFALTEPNVGSDAADIQCAARYDASQKGYIVNGTKQFITNAIGADVIVLAARTGDPASRKEGISVFLAEKGKDAKSVSVTETYEKIGMFGAVLGSIKFSDYFVPEEAMLGEENRGWEVIQGTLEHSRLWIAAQAVGISQHAYDEAKTFTEQRIQGGEPLGMKKNIVNHLTLMDYYLNIARFLVQKAAGQEARQDPSLLAWASLAKYVASESAFQIAADAGLLHGGRGALKETPVIQLMNDAQITRLYEGASHIQVNILDRFKIDNSSGIVKKEYDREKLLPLVYQSAATLRSAATLPPLPEVKAEIESWKIRR